MTITSDIWKGESIPDKVNPGGLKKSNCYRCRSLEFERNLVRVDNRKKNKNGWVSGDALLICKKCAKGK